MADIEKVTKGLEHCLSRYVDGLCDDCPYMGAIDKTYMVPMKCKEIIMRDALELLKEQNGLILALEQAYAAINYLNEEKEKALRNIDLYVADAENDAKTPSRTGKGYSVGMKHGLQIAKEILQGIRNHG